VTLLEAVREWLFFFGREAALSPTASQRVPSFAISASGSDFNLQNPQCIPAVKIFAFLDLAGNLAFSDSLLVENKRSIRLKRAANRGQDRT